MQHAIKKNRLYQEQINRIFIAGITARCVAELIDINRNTAGYIIFASRDYGYYLLKKLEMHLYDGNLRNGDLCNSKNINIEVAKFFNLLSVRTNNLSVECYKKANL